MNFQELYESKKVSLDEALGYIRSNDNVCFAGDCNEPKRMADATKAGYRAAASIK